jgi:hypothetical protein
LCAPRRIKFNFGNHGFCDRKSGEEIARQQDVFDAEMNNDNEGTGSRTQMKSKWRSGTTLNGKN